MALVPAFRCLFFRCLRRWYVVKDDFPLSLLTYFCFVALSPWHNRRRRVCWSTLYFCFRAHQEYAHGLTGPNKMLAILNLDQLLFFCLQEVTERDRPITKGCYCSIVSDGACHLTPLPLQTCMFIPGFKLNTHTFWRMTRSKEATKSHSCQNNTTDGPYKETNPPPPSNPDSWPMQGRKSP